MQISLSEAGKRFNRDWIFRKISYDFSSGNSYAITGPNGSGKSTLLQVIAGAMVTSEGQVSYKISGKKMDGEQVYKLLSIAAPYQELIEEMTLTEFLSFHGKFKPLLAGFTVARAIGEVNLSSAANRQIRYFSSGMKQRAKLAQAFFSDVPCLLLDEPCTNLDVEGIALYHRLVEQYTRDRLVIVSSNDVQEYGFCTEEIRMEGYK
jgi:ABC-type multidrug transport system ATPase subunit